MLLNVAHVLFISVLPEEYAYPIQSFADVVAVNGSSRTGRCSIFITSGSRKTCSDPISSVLFDGNVPTLTGLDGDRWANQLLTISIVPPTIGEIFFDFTDTPNYTGVERVELVIFNCPEWGISVRTIQFLGAATVDGRIDARSSVIPTITSCDSLVRVCISQSVSSTIKVLFLQFTLPSTSNWVHLGEVTFYASGSTCPPDTVLTPQATPRPSVTLMPTPLPTTTMVSFVIALTTEVIPSSLAPTPSPTTQCNDDRWH